MLASRLSLRMQSVAAKERVIHTCICVSTSISRWHQPLVTSIAGSICGFVIVTHRIPRFQKRSCLGVNKHPTKTIQPLHYCSITVSSGHTFEAAKRSMQAI